MGIAGLCLLGFQLFSEVSLAQSVDYNRIILPASVGEVDFSERLVQLAWANHPSNTVVQMKAEQTQYEINRAKLGWMQRFFVAGNLNEFTIRGQNENFFFPRYNIGVTLPLGVFVETPNQTKIAKTEQKIAYEQVNQQKLAIRAQVLSLYQNYTSLKEIFRIQSEITEDENARYILVEQQFKMGEATLEKLNEALRGYNEQMLRKIRSENDMLQTKIQLEELIGMPLEEVR